MKKNDFSALGVSDEITSALRTLGITEPTPIQKEAIPAVFAGSDIIAQAQTGTGKTLAFVLPMLEQINPEQPHVQALVVTPTRELAIQITEEVKRLAPIKKLRVLSAYGGQDVERQIRKLEGNIHIIVATPGRLLDHLRRETVQLHKLSVLVLDEADQMLHMGFLPEVEQIIAVTPSRRQTLLFSATMPPRIRDLAKAYMKPAVEIEVKAKRVTLDEIEQVVIQTTDRGKLDALCRAIEEDPPYLAMIFCRTKLRAGKLNDELLERGYSCDELHGDLTQAKREQVMKRFREAKIQFLVATDIAARGLDVEGITHVYNYDIPHDAESYIHRIGRTGRAGQTGKAITFAAPRDAQYLELIERGIKMTLSKRPGRGQSEPRSERRDADADGRGTGRAGGRGDKPVRGGTSRGRGQAAERGGGRRGTAARAGSAARGARGGGAEPAWQQAAAPGGGRRGTAARTADGAARGARGGSAEPAWQQPAAPGGARRGTAARTGDGAARGARTGGARQNETAPGRGAGRDRAAGQGGDWFNAAPGRRTADGRQPAGGGRAGRGGDARTSGRANNSGRGGDLSARGRSGGAAKAGGPGARGGANKSAGRRRGR